MADLTNDALVARNYQKTQDTTTLGTRQLAFLVVDVNQNVETDYLLPNSLYSQAVRGLQQCTELYVIGEPNGENFTVVVAAGTAPFGEGQAVGDGNRVQYIEERVNAAIGGGNVRVWNAKLRGNNLNYD
jgi:hypothetical protein